MMYCTPTKLWQRYLPKSIRPEDFEQGEVSAVARAGGGDGLVSVTRAWPKDAYQVVLRIKQSGELSAARYDYTLDGTTWSAEAVIPSSGGPVSLPGLGALRVADSGLEVTFVDGAANPSFVLGASYTFSTTASPQVLGHLLGSASWVDSYLGTDLVLPVDNPDEVLCEVVGRMAVAGLVTARGLDPGNNDKIYRQEKDDALRWLAELRDKAVRLAQAKEGGGPIAGIRASSRAASGWGSWRERSGS